MKTIKLNLYSFDELDEKAKRSALMQSNELNFFDGWWDFVYEDFMLLSSFLGFQIDKKSVVFEGFYSQGDGSGFSAEVDLLKLCQSISNQSWKQYAPQQEFTFGQPEIDHRVMALIKEGKLELSPKIISKRRTYGVICDLGIYPESTLRLHHLIYDELDKLETWLQQIAITLNKRLFKSLQAEYEYLASDEAIADTLMANEYSFTSYGKLATCLEKLSITTN